jgi:hypothetical protein
MIAGEVYCEEIRCSFRVRDQFQHSHKTRKTLWDLNLRLEFGDSFSEALIFIYQTTRSHIEEGRNHDTIVVLYREYTFRF